MKAVTAETMQQLDRRTIEEFGISGLELMENAGAGTAAIINKRFGTIACPAALIFAGRGNNGGDGLVIARVLASMGWRVEVLLFADAAALAGDARANFERLPETVKSVTIDTVVVDELPDRCRGFTVLVDALFGTGLRNALSGRAAEAAVAANSSGVPVVAVDIPSGVDASSGRVPGEAVRAAVTVTFGAAKLGHILYPGAELTGELVVIDIGIPATLIREAAGAEFVDEPFAASLLKPRSRIAHKGSCGHLLIVAGSTGKSGAAAMSANSAMRSGAGLVTLAVPASLHAVLEMKTTEVMTTPLSDGGRGCLGTEALPEIERLITGRNAAAIGPGLGWNADAAALVRQVIAAASLPLVIDADGLNAISEDLAVLRSRRSAPLILTPHPGEMSRLTGMKIADIEADRIGVAGQFAREHKLFLVLKGARTVIAAPDGRVAVNGSGNPGMASGGMGDVLTGVITALLVQGYEPFSACCLGVFVHGLAADMVAAEKGEIGLIATDVQEMLPLAFRRLARNGQRPDSLHSGRYSERDLQ